MICRSRVCGELFMLPRTDDARDKKWFGLVPVTFLSSDGDKISVVAFPDVVGYIPAAGQIHPTNDAFAFLLKEYEPDAANPGMYDLYVFGQCHWYFRIRLLLGSLKGLSSCCLVA